MVRLWNENKENPHIIKRAAGFPGLHFVASLSAAFGQSRGLHISTL